MKLTLIQAKGLYQGIQEFKQSKPVLDFNVWYELSNIHQKLKPAMESYELKYSQFIDQFAEKDKDGNNKMLTMNPPTTAIKEPKKLEEALDKLDEETINIKINKISKDKFKDVKMEGSVNMFSIFEHVIN